MRLVGLEVTAVSETPGKLAMRKAEGGVLVGEEEELFD